MRKVLLLANAFSLLLALLISPAEAQLLRLDIKEFWCMDGQYHVRFSVVNRYAHDAQVTVAFKLFEEETLFACKRVPLDVPANTDGSDTHKVSIEAPCKGLRVVLKGRLFDWDERSRVGIWLTHCP